MYETFRGTKHNVARHHGGAADQDRNVHADQGDFENRARVLTLVEDGEIFEFVDPLVIANAALDDDALAGPSANRGGEVIADEGAILDLAEQIDHQHIAGLQLIDDPGVLPAVAAFAILHHDPFEVRTSRHELGGHDPAGQDDIGMHVDEAVREIEVIIVALFAYRPDFVVRRGFHSLENVIINGRSAVLETRTFPQWRQCGYSLR